MTSYLLDTNVCIALINDTSELTRRRYEQARAANDVVLVSSVVAFELWFGVGKSARPAQNGAVLQHFLDGPVQLLPFESGDARLAGELRAHLRALGTPIGPYDVLLSGQSLRHGATLVTANVSKFARVPGLIWEDWAS